MKAISSMATRDVLAELARAAARAGHPPVDIESIGGVDAARRVAEGEQVDLVFLADDALRRLAAEGHVDAATVTPIVRSSVAVAVASTTADVPLRDAEDVRTALRDAARIGYSTGPSGTKLLRLIEDWGLSDELADRLVQARPGKPVARLIADGEVDLGVQQLSELVGQPGVRVVDLLPPDCAIETVFAGALAASATRPGAALSLLRFVASDDVAPLKRAAHFTPL